MYRPPSEHHLSCRWLAQAVQRAFQRSFCKWVNLKQIGRFHAVALQVPQGHPQLLTSPQWTDPTQYIATYGKH